MTDMEPAQAIAAIKAILGITSTPPAPAFVAADEFDLGDWVELIDWARTFTAEQKVQLIEAMGFTPGGDDHQWDCGYRFDPGINCNCYPPATVWSQPHDVDVLRKETLEDRRNDKRDRRIPACER